MPEIEFIDYVGPLNMLNRIFIVVMIWVEGFGRGILDGFLSFLFSPSLNGNCFINDVTLKLYSMRELYQAGAAELRDENWESSCSPPSGGFLARSFYQVLVPNHLLSSSSFAW